MTITLDPDDITYDEHSNTARFTPGSRVRSATYTTYALDLASLEAVLGGRPSAPVDVVVELGPEQVQYSTPEDPSVPAPAGGFRIVTRAGRVIRRAR